MWVVEATGPTGRTVRRGFETEMVARAWEFLMVCAGWQTTRPELVDAPALKAVD